MLRETVDRLAPLAPAAQTLILTSASLASAVRELLPEIPGENIIAEPRAAGTAAALSWAAHTIARRAGPEAVMIFCKRIFLAGATALGSIRVRRRGRSAATEGDFPNWGDYSGREAPAPA